MFWHFANFDSERQSKVDFLTYKVGVYIDQSIQLLAQNLNKKVFQMDNTWASGALELLQHADSHINLKSAFDSRIAFISVDNSVEISIRVFQSLPEKISGKIFTRKERDDAGNSFSKMVELLFNKASDVLVGLSDTDIEYYHRIRNQLYHEGTGLAVDFKQLQEYRQVAAVLLNNLFGIELQPKTRETSIAYLIVLCNEVEVLVKNKFESSEIDTGHTFKWEMAMKEGILNFDQIKALTDLRMIRNLEVHATESEINNKRIEYAIELAEMLINKLKS
jgi:hypothetical protein